MGLASKVPWSIAHMEYVTQASSYGLGLGKTCSNISTLNQYKDLAAQPGSPVNAGIGNVWHIYALYRGCRLLPALGKGTWEALAAVWSDPRCTSRG
jgi:hypothetical protein